MSSPSPIPFPNAGAPIQALPLLPSGIAGDVPEAGDLGGILALVGKAIRPLPLVALKVRARLLANLARTEVEQQFANPFDQPLEVVHIFPVRDGAAITGLSLTCGDLRAEAECRGREEAESVFAAARREGHLAAILDRADADVHTLRVTRIPAGEAVTVRFTLEETLTAIDGDWQWRFPTVIAPRYLPGEAIGHSGPGVLPDTDRVPLGSHLQPPLLLGGGARLDLEVDVQGPVASVASSLHAIGVTLPAGTGEADLLRVNLAASATLDRDFILRVTPLGGEEQPAQAWTDGAYTLVAVAAPEGLIATRRPREAVLVLDVSGSMEGAKLEAARRALSSVLHGLEAGDRFQLLAFNTHLQAFAPEAQAYTQEALDRADAWIAALRADGGTEMLPAVQAALAGAPPDGLRRSVLFITDGQVWNTDELVAAVGHRRGAARFYTLGIDSAVNESLLKRMAQAGGGTCDLATPHDDIEALVLRMDQRMDAPVLWDLRVAEDEPGRREALDVFSARRLTLLLAGAPERILVTGQTASGAYSTTATPLRSPFPLATRWAQERIAWLEERRTMRPFEGEAIRPEIRRLAVAHGLVSAETSLVVVERRRSVEGELIEVVQPAALPHLWDETFSPMVFSARPQYLKAGRRTAGRMVSDADRATYIGASTMEDYMAFGEAFDALAWSEPLAESAAPVAESSAARPESPDGTLARSQQADGSWGGDPLRTAAALLALRLLDPTGLRQRTVLKAVRWLQAQVDGQLDAQLDAQREAPLLRTVLAANRAIDSGAADARDSLRGILDAAMIARLQKAGAEGAALREALERPG